MSAERTAVVEDLRVVHIHGQPFYEIMYHYEDEPAKGAACRLSGEQVPEGLKPGDRVKILLVLSTVMRMERLL